MSKNIKVSVSADTTDSNTTHVKPLPSRKFRVQNIIKSLTDHFIECWKYEKSNSSKLSYYNTCKTKFAREPYLDISKGFSRRYSTTKFRISSHDLEIECGRYNNVVRDARICTWCRMSMGSEVIEDENHLINDCDLYAGLRNKLITRLNNAPESHLHPSINNDLLKIHFHSLLSPYSSMHNDEDNVFNNHHNRKDSNEDSQHRHKYIINCMCTFICRALETRRKYMKDVRERENRANTLVIHFTSN